MVYNITFWVELSLLPLRWEKCKRNSVEWCNKPFPEIHLGLNHHQRFSFGEFSSFIILLIKKNALDLSPNSKTEGNNKAAINKFGIFLFSNQSELVSKRCVNKCSILLAPRVLRTFDKGSRGMPAFFISPLLLLFFILVLKQFRAS